MSKERTYPVTLIGREICLGVFPVSWETNGLGDLTVPKMPFRYKATRLITEVVEDVAASDAATVTLKKGATTLGSTSHAASAQIGDEQEDTSITDHYIDMDEQLTLTVAKSTAGGRGFAAIWVEVLESRDKT